MSKKRYQSEPPVDAYIEKFSHDGRGIARINGKTTFIEGALPGEHIHFQYTKQKKDFDEGRLVSVLTSAPDRVIPRCSHYGLCGGCSLQHLAGAAQIQQKQTLLLDLFERISHIQPKQVLAPLSADFWHYRNKARLSVRYVEKKQAVLVGFREKNNPRYITEISHCPVLHAQVEAQIPTLRDLIGRFTDPHCIAQVEVAAGDEEVVLIFRNLNALKKADEDNLIQFAQQSGFRIFLQPDGVDSVYLFYPQDGRDLLSYALPEENIRFEFHPTDFTQVNGKLNRIMVKYALELLVLEPQDRVLDLFCGLGNFALAMAKQCAHVVGIEGSEAMVKRAFHNAAINHITNVDFFSANLEEEEALYRLKTKEFDKVLLDPPRTGALTLVNQMHCIHHPRRIVYVSCNPATLARDSEILVNQQGYDLLAAGVMDMFPHTAHVESIAVFERR